MASSVAFVGLGRMGLPMADRLLAAGFSLRVFNRTASRADDLVARGARLFGSPAEAAREAEFAVTMVADDRALLDVVLGPHGLAAGLPAGSIHLSMSTVSPNVNRTIGQAHQEAGSELVGAPVLGRPEAVVGGTLWIMAAGRPELEPRCQPLLAALGRGYTWLGTRADQANIAKIGFNFFLFGMAEALAEALTLVEKQGVDRSLYFEAVNAAFRSPMVEGYGRRMLTEAFLPAGFTSTLALKDVGLALDLAEQGQAPSPVASLLRDNLLTAIARGRADWDVAALVHVARERAGLV